MVFNLYFDMHVRGSSNSILKFLELEIAMCIWNIKRQLVNFTFYSNENIALK
jgi:hypothetical protein